MRSPRLLFILLLLVLSASQLIAGSIIFQFTAGSLAPTVSGLPAGVSAGSLVFGSKFQAVPGVSGNLFDEGGSPDALRITGTDAAPDTTGASFTAGTTLSFTIDIAQGIAIDLLSLSLEYRGTAVSGRSNARLFSSIRGHANATNETIGVLGRESSGTDASFFTDTINLAVPRSNASVGSTIQNGDFTGLTNRSVTFDIPWMDGATTADSFIDLDNLTLTFSEPGAPEPGLAIAGFERLADRTTRVSFTGLTGHSYALMASGDVLGPVYRKRWSLLGSGTFAGNTVVLDDAAAPAASSRFYVVSDGALPKARIMPVGDSITEGGTGISVYRGPLFDKLNAAGYRFIYVGSKTSTYGANTLAYEAYSGNNAQQVAAQVAAHFATYPADVVLIHSAHNYNVAEAVLDDAGTAQIVSNVETATRSMISTCRSVNPKVIVLLAQVITSGKLPKYSYIPAVNVRLGALAAELNTSESRIIAVNQAEGFDPNTDTISDKVHPNAQGGEKMAVKWFQALAPLLE